MSLSRDVNLRTYRPLHHPHSDQPLLSPKDGGHTLANCIDDSSKTCAKTLSSSPSRSLSSFFFSFFLLFFFLYLLPAERPRVINQIIRWVRLDFCLATFEFGSRGFDDEGKDCCGGVDLPSFLLLLPPPSPSFLPLVIPVRSLSPSYTYGGVSLLGDSGGLRRWPASQLEPWRRRRCGGSGHTSA